MVKEAKNSPTTIRFSESDADLLRRLSEQEDVSVATIVRKAIRSYAEVHLAPAPKRKK